MAAMRLVSRRVPLARKLVPAIESPVQRRFASTQAKVSGFHDNCIYFEQH